MNFAFLFDSERSSASSGGRPSRGHPVGSAAESTECLAEATVLLLGRLREDDASAIADLVDQHYAQLLRYASTIVDEDSAVDIVQDVFVALWDRRQTVVMRSSVIGYLIRAVRNTALNHVRAERAEYDRAERGYEITAPPSPDIALDEQERQQALNSAIQALPSHYRDVIALRALGLGYSEIADILGVALKTVQTRATRGIAILRQRLANYL